MISCVREPIACVPLVFVDLQGVIMKGSRKSLAICLSAAIVAIMFAGVSSRAASEKDKTFVPTVPYATKICVATPKTNLAPAETAAESLRNSLVKYLSGPAAEIVVLTAMVPVQQRAEAVEKGCNFYLTASMMQKKKGGGEGFGGFLKQGAGAAPLLNDLPGGKTAATVSTVATRSSAKMSVAGDLAISIKAKDEVSLEYSLVNVQSQAVGGSGKLKAKASKDGDDILSSLLEQAVNSVLEAAIK